MGRFAAPAYWVKRQPGQPIWVVASTEDPVRRRCVYEVRGDLSPAEYRDPRYRHLGHRRLRTNPRNLRRTQGAADELHRRKLACPGVWCGQPPPRGGGSGEEARQLDWDPRRPVAGASDTRYRTSPAPDVPGLVGRPVLPVSPQRQRQRQREPRKGQACRPGACGVRIGGRR